MQKDTFPFLLPNTFRDSNEISSSRQELILPSAPSVELMDFNNESRHSIIRPVESDNSLSPHIDPSNQNRVTNKSLGRSIIRPNGNDDERPSQEQPQQPFNESLINEDHSSLLEAAGYDPSQFAAIDADAEFALRLQQEEYARESLPNRQHFLPFQVEPNEELSDSNLPIYVEPDTPRFTNDEEFAAYLQQRENQNRQRYHHRPQFPFHSTRPRANPPSTQVTQIDDDEHESASPIRFLQQRRPVHNEEDDDDDDEGSHMYDAHAFLQFLTNAGHPMAGSLAPFFRGGRRGRRTGNLQDTEEDFGPEDYERLLQLDDAVHKKKLTKYQINTIKEIQFHHKANNTDEENKCGVCLELFEENQALRQFPCDHVYHKECADRWLQENNVCPICRKPPIQTQSTSNSRHHRGAGGSRRPIISSNRGSSNRNNSSNNSNNTHRRGPPPHRQS